MRAPRPSGLPHKIPAWAWKWLRWRTRKPAPKPAPKPTPLPAPPAPKLPIQGCDYVSGPSPSALKAAHMRFVCRYIAPPGSAYDWKRLATAEASALHKAGLPIVLVFESSEKRATGGSVAGSQDAGYALLELHRLGAAAPVGAAFACDFDVPDYAPKLANTHANALAKLGPVGAYFKAIRPKLAGRQLGAYGGYWVIKRLFDAGLIDWGWQTYAWSAGLWDPRAQLQQYANGRQVGGHQVDLDRAVHYPYGQWPPSP